jgi:hypothetical protein
MSTSGFLKMIGKIGELPKLGSLEVHPHMLRHAGGLKRANDVVDTTTIQEYRGPRGYQARRDLHTIARHQVQRMATESIFHSSRSSRRRNSSESFASSMASRFNMAQAHQWIYEGVAALMAHLLAVSVGGLVLPSPKVHGGSRSAARQNPVGATVILAMAKRAWRPEYRGKPAASGPVLIGLMRRQTTTHLGAPIAIECRCAR